MSNSGDIQVIAGSGPPPNARPRRGRRGPYSVVYDKVLSLRPGEWFRVAESATWDERKRVLAYESIRKGLANRDLLDVLDCYCDHAGNIIVAAKKGST